MTGRAKDGDKLVTWWAKTVEGKMTAILVNTAETPATVEVDLPFLGRRRYDLGRFEIRTVPGP